MYAENVLSKSLFELLNLPPTPRLAKDLACDGMKEFLMLICFDEKKRNIFILYIF